MKRVNSNYHKNIAETHIAHGALTNSKRPECFVEGVYPSHASGGYKCYLKDADKNVYTDYICGLGTNFFGYANHHINDAVRDALLSGGCALSLSTCKETEFAQQFCNTFPFIDKVRFLKSGSEGCSAAIRIARAFTGREWVVSEGYHGWHDNFVGLTPPARGVTKDYTMSLSDKSLPPHNIAAYIIEPVITDNSKERIHYLQELREKCTKTGALLIFDETITAYRYRNFSVALDHNIYPDLWIGGKAVAGGLPLSIVGGRRDVMDANYFVSSTWAGDRLALYAAEKALELLHGEYNPTDLWPLGAQFLEEFNAISPQVQIEGYPTRGSFKYLDQRFKARFMQEMCLAGVLIGPSWFYNKWLHDEKDNVLAIAKAAVKKIVEGNVEIRGKLPKNPFAERFRNAR
jgi:glutamate-1-semialdehyde aminotransferase